MGERLGIAGLSSILALLLTGEVLAAPLEGVRELTFRVQNLGDSRATESLRYLISKGVFGTSVDSPGLSPEESAAMTRARGHLDEARRALDALARERGLPSPGGAPERIR
jgi:hypothetical protein